MQAMIASPPAAEADPGVASFPLLFFFGTGNFATWDIASWTALRPPRARYTAGDPSRDRSEAFSASGFAEGISATRRSDRLDEPPPPLPPLPPPPPPPPTTATSGPAAAPAASPAVGVVLEFRNKLSRGDAVAAEPEEAEDVEDDTDPTDAAAGDALPVVEFVGAVPNRVCRMLGGVAPVDPDAGAEVVEADEAEEEEEDDEGLSMGIPRSCFRVLDMTTETTTLYPTRRI